MILAAEPASPPAWTQPMDPVHIAGELWDVGAKGISAFVLKTKDGLILLDAGMPASAPTLLGNIEKLGYRISDVKLIVTSHAHFDHAGGLAAVKAATGAKLAVMDADVHWDETGTYPGRTDTAANFEPVKVDRVLHDGDTVSLGGETLTAHKTPGHTPGCTTWTFPVHEAGKTYTAMYHCSFSVAANVLVGPKTSYPGIVDDYRRGFATLKTLKADIFLAPHPEQFGFAEKLAKLKAGGPNPFIDPTELSKRIAAGEAAFGKDLAKQESAMSERTTARATTVTSSTRTTTHASSLGFSNRGGR